MDQEEFPTGVVTFLFTDLENSTHLWEKYPLEMKSALAQHDAILVLNVNAENGRIVKTTGDGLHAVFRSPIEGVQAVVSAQRTILSEDWGKTGPLRVRMALHSGEAEFRDGDYYGSVVNRAARIMGIASGEQILVSASTAILIGDQLQAGVSFLDLGKHYLRGLSHPEEFYQVVLPID